ncbi:zinc finger protein-like 1 isoform X2 [Rhipicephalus microplus]|uniref:zinc finger protein-like 1 isoform X2 n=1 Tax=Rhipicephalus microplus TaxID=6941 RepID=UPI003F6BD2C7
MCSMLNQLSYHDVFHWACLDDHCKRMPKTTAPAGYGCPSCGSAIVPAINIESPVADALNMLLKSASWANAGPSIPEITQQKQPSGPQGDLRQANASPVNSLAQSAPPPWRAQSSAPNTASPLHTAIAPENSVNYGTATNSHLTSSRKVFTATQANFVTSAPDYDEDKYKRRSGFELLSRWIKSRTIMAGSRRRDPHTFLKRWVVLSILIVLGLFTVVYFLMHWGRAAAESDPLLDPRLNPNIRVNDESQDLQPR